jgi:hypothetical protein
VAARIRNPVLFSHRFGLSTQDLAAADILDPVLNADTKVFVDPVLIATSANETLRGAGHRALIDRFSKVTKLLAVSRAADDPAWKGARRLLDLSERRETCLGYGAASVRGSSRPAWVTETILGTTKQILELGVENPEIISLMGFLDEGIGPGWWPDVRAANK